MRVTITYRDADVTDVVVAEGTDYAAAKDSAGSMLPDDLTVLNIRVDR